MPNNLSFTPALTLTRLNALLSELGGRINYVDRGDPAAEDWTKTNLTTDGTWRDLDCSAIVPAGAKLIHFNILLYDDVAGQTFKMRKNGNSNDVNTSTTVLQVANRFISNSFFVSCDANRIVEYVASNVVWTVITIAVKGWFI